MATMMSLTTRVARGEDEAEQTAIGAPGRESGKPFPARIDVDDSIKRDDLGRTDQIGQVNEAAVQIGDARLSVRRDIT